MPKIDVDALTFDMGDTITDLREGLPEYEARGVLRAGRIYDLLLARGYALPEREAFCKRLAVGIEERYAASHARGQGLTIDAALAGLLREDAGLAVDDDLVATAAADWCRPGGGTMPLRVGARETLAALRAAGLRLGVISNTIQPGRYLDANLQRAGLREFFHTTVYSSDVGVPKPHRPIFEAALAGLGLPAQRVAHVGDRLVADVAGAQAAGMLGILIELPHRRESDPAVTPDASIRELPELLGLLGL